MSQLFYTPHIENGFARLEEEESRHLVSVLRRQPGDRLELTDGKGFFYTAELVEAGKKNALARILETRPGPGSAAWLHLAVAPTKQIDRFEWLLEKAAEIGVQEITPLQCKRSERTTLRPDRLEKILISAMKQSLQCRLPALHPLTPLTRLLQHASEPQRLIAWCSAEPLPQLRDLLQPATNTLILIGPEGDFAPEEVELAQRYGFKGVGLGATRLRTETAGLVAVAGFRLLQRG